ncbi:MAG: tetratricopeptide repeat protein, partial [Chloroflexota bacterium]
MTEPITVDERPFFGRIEEQKLFRLALAETLAPPAEEELPYVFLLYGDGGMGKTTLARRFRDLALAETPYAGKFQLLWVDWDDEKKKFAGLQVGPEFIQPETSLGVVHAAAARQKWGRQLQAYRKALSQRELTEKKVAEMLVARDNADELAILRTAGVTAIARIIRSKLPMIGEGGEKLVRTFLDAGVKVGVEQAARIRASLETYLRAQLKPDHFNYFLNPNEVLAQALARGLKKVAERQPLLVFMDSYEIVDHADVWLRAVIEASGPTVIWVISGRNDLVRSRQFGEEYFKGYADDFPRRLLAFHLPPLARHDVRAYFHFYAPKRTLAQSDLEAIGRATRGIPLAVHEAAELWKAGASLVQIVGDAEDSAPGQEIVQKMTDRYLQHVVAEADRQAIYALALARGDVELLRAMLYRDNDERSDLDALLRRLERHYASVHAARARLHNDPAHFLTEYLRADVRRSGEPVKRFNEQAVATLRQRLARLEPSLKLTEDRCQDEDWVKTVLDLTHYLFWLDPAAAWRWLVPHFIEGLAYNSSMLKGLLQIAREWKEAMSQGSGRLLAILQAGQRAAPGSDDEAALLEVLTRAQERGFLEGDNLAELEAILELRLGQLFFRRGQLKEAQDHLERAETGLPPGGRLLQRQLGATLEALARRFTWPNGRRQPVHAAEAERLLQKVVEWLPDQPGVWYHLGVVQEAAGRQADALTAYQRAVELDPRFTLAHNGLGNVYRATGRQAEAQAAYQQAIRLDPTYAIPHSGLGALLVESGRHGEALDAYQKAIELDPHHPAPLTGLGQTFLGVGQVKPAIEAYQKAIEIDPADAISHCGLGDAYTQLGQYEAAVAAYEQALAGDPKLAAAYNGRANVYTLQGRHREAVEAYRQAIALNPHYMAAHCGLGSLYLSLGRSEEAAASYQQALAIDPRLPAAHYGLGVVAYGQRRYPEALPAFQQALHNGQPDEAQPADPQNPRPSAPSAFYNTLGDTYLALGRSAEALAAFQQATQPNNECGRMNDERPESSSFILHHSSMLLALPCPSVACAHYAHLGLGNAHCAAGRLEEALASYRRAAQLGPQEAAVYTGLGRVYHQLNRLDEAVAAYLHALALEPTLAAAHSGLGDVYQVLGRSGE